MENRGKLDTAYCAKDKIPPGELIGLRRGIEQTYKNIIGKQDENR